ncbi:hypothetical protein [Lolliginicoccus suaedae]|uniref:hypothetical protein n=1 Tax=Lolliginicoccus suaedae TaxID=2605429 RepID=UPI0011EF71DE|nr:hypothetical protein [Lolliginicoccus suaedae]
MPGHRDESVIARWSAAPGTVIALAVGTVVLVLAAILVRRDPIAVILACLAAAVLLGTATWLARSAIVLADHEGEHRLHVRGLLGTARTLRAEDLVAVTVLRRHRSRSSWVLGLELRQPPDQLVLRGRWELDEDPWRVADQLWSHGFPR